MKSVLLILCVALMVILLPMKNKFYRFNCGEFSVEIKKRTRILEKNPSIIQTNGTECEMVSHGGSFLGVITLATIQIQPESEERYGPIGDSVRSQ